MYGIILYMKVGLFMEKIYMEENKKSRRSGNRKPGFKLAFGSLALVLVAVLGIVIASFSRSYAVDTVTNRLPDTFTTAQVTKDLYSTGGSGAGVHTAPYFTDGGIQVFCLEHTIDFEGDTSYSKDEAIDDYGLLYLMANIYPNVNYDTFLNDDLQSWISQIAIWMYLYENEKLTSGVVDPSSPNYISDEEIVEIKAARGVFIDDDFSVIYTGNPDTGGQSNVSVTASDPLLYDKYIKPLVDAALANRTVVKPSLYINFDKNIAITQDDKYYQTSQVSVAGSPATNFNGYELVLDSAPSGTFVVDVNGNKIEDLKNMSVTDKFYFRIPVDSVTEDNKVVKFSINGSFRGYSGYKYTAPGAQTITGVSTEDTVYSNGAEIPLNYSPNVPDTGMSTAQTVYFIGLIILLSGVGIIYANVKPEESK